MSAKKIRIVLCDDHQIIREGLHSLLEKQADMIMVGEGTSGLEAIRLVADLSPDVIVLDVAMPDMNGITAARRLHDDHPKVKILALSMHSDMRFVTGMMEAGASGYLLKTAREKDLIDSIRGVSSGEPVLHPAIAMKIARLWAQRGTAATQASPEQLSPRELEVLDLAAKGLRNKAIADKLGISTRTVEGHFNSIFGKLGVSSRMEAILEAMSRHLVTISDEKRDSQG